MSAISPADATWSFPNPATPPGSSAYYSVRFAPRDLHRDLAALLGWRHLVHGVPDRVSDRGVAARKLAWWHDELERLFAGTARHPLGASLGPAILRAGLPQRPFLDILWGAEALLADRRMTDTAALAAMADLDTGALFELMARSHGESESATLGAARRAGVYCGLVELVRDSGRLLRADRRGFLPADLLARHGLSHDAAVGAIRARLAPLLLDLAPQLRKFRDDPARLPATLRIRVRLADRLLAELAESGFEVADQRIALTPVRKLWHAWRESRSPGSA